MLVLCSWILWVIVLKSSKKNIGICYCFWPTLFALRQVSRGVSTGFVFDLLPFAALCETHNTQHTDTDTDLCHYNKSWLKSTGLCVRGICSIVLPENGGSGFFENAGNHLWKPRISKSNTCLYTCLIICSFTCKLCCEVVQDTHHALDSHHHKPLKNRRCKQLCK